MTFSHAFEAIRIINSNGMRLSQWEDNVVIKVQLPDKKSKMTAPYLYVRSKSGKVPWIATMIELFADNWEILAQRR